MYDVLDELQLEIARLYEKYKDFPIAIEVLQMVSCWAMEESVPLANESSEVKKSL